MLARLRSTWRRNGLSIVIASLFVLFMAGQAAVGVAQYNEERLEHGQASIGLGEYLVTGHFLEATAENWESEFLQMAAYVLLTVWLFQKGSSESKKPGGKEVSRPGSAQLSPASTSLAPPGRFGAAE